MSKPGLLIVDDQEEIRSHLRWALDDTYDVHPVGNAREALAYMKRERPPLVTLDLGLLLARMTPWKAWLCWRVCWPSID